MTINEYEQKHECVWSQDCSGSDTYATQCGHYFSITDGTPTENNFKFCVFCGKKLLEELCNDDDQ